METHISSMALMSVSSSLFGISLPACHRVQRSSMWKMMCFPMKIKSHSTWVLNLSGSSMLHAVSGPGLAHSLQTRHVCTISGIKSLTFWDTPTRSRKRLMVLAEACHHLTCSFRSESRMALSLFVRNNRTTRPMSKFVQSSGRSGLLPTSW